MVSKGTLYEECQTNGYELTSESIIAYNPGLDDITPCRVGYVITLPTPIDPINAIGDMVPTQHLVLVAMDDRLNDKITPEFSFRFFKILPFNSFDLKVIYPEDAFEEG